MYDTDPAFTGFNDSNRGVPVGFDNMRVEDGVLRLQARAATANENPICKAQGMTWRRW
jgi:hypothetical protein